MKQFSSIKNANKGEEMLLNLLIDFENQIEIKDREFETKHTFYMYGDKYEINIKVNNAKESSKINSINHEKESIINIEIIKNNKDKIIFTRELKNKINNKERIIIQEELEKTIIKELNLNKKEGLFLSESFIEYENKVNIVNTVTNNELYKKAIKELKKITKSIYEPESEIKEKTKKAFEKNGVDSKKIAEKINEKLEFSIPKIKLFLFADGKRQYLCYKNEWYMKANDEIIYNDNVYNITNKQFYKIIEDKKIPFQTVEEYLNKLEEDIKEVKEKLKKIDKNDKSILIMEKNIIKKRKRLNRIRKKMLNVSEKYFINSIKITNFSELELFYLTIELLKSIREEQEREILQKKLKNN